MKKLLLNIFLFLPLLSTAQFSGHDFWHYTEYSVPDCSFTVTKDSFIYITLKDKHYKIKINSDYPISIETDGQIEYYYTMFGENPYRNYTFDTGRFLNSLQDTLVLKSYWTRTTHKHKLKSKSKKK